MELRFLFIYFSVCVNTLITVKVLFNILLEIFSFMKQFQCLSSFISFDLKCNLIKKRGKTTRYYLFYFVGVLKSNRRETSAKFLQDRRRPHL